jgi:hypothetical protein
MQLWREAHVELKMLKASRVQSSIEKARAAIARRTFQSQNVENTSAPERSWKLKYSRSSRGCGANYICKPNFENASAPQHFWKLSYSKSARGWRSTFRNENCKSTSGSSC